MSWFSFVRLVLIVVAASAIASRSEAQAPADVQLRQGAGVYEVKVQSPTDLDLDRVCVERVDVTPAFDLGCSPAAPSEIVTISVTISRTPLDDAELRAFAYDLDGNKSEPSPNAGLVDFTPPNGPVVR